MFERILVVCTGNICRSPLAATLTFTRGLIEKRARPVPKSGRCRLEGHAPKKTVSRIAAEHGISLAGSHCATPVNIDATRQAELILAMEQRHVDAPSSPLTQRWHVAKTFLLGHWSSRNAGPSASGKGRLSCAHAQIAETTGEWLARL